MRYGIMLLLVLLAGIIVLSGCGQQRTTYGDLLGKRVKVSSYRGTVKAPTGQEPMIMLIQMKNGKMSKMKADMPSGFMLHDVEKKSLYIGDTTKHTAMLMSTDKTGSDMMSDMDFTSMLAAGLTEETVSTKTETVNGVKCWIFEPKKGSEVLAERLYIDDQYGLIRKATGLASNPPDPSGKGNSEVNPTFLLIRLRGHSPL